MNSEKIKLRYNFSMSAFSRMYGTNAVSASKDIQEFCHKWSESNEETPDATLVSINFYFKDRWDAWGGNL